MAPDMWTDPSRDPRGHIDHGEGEKAVLTDYLERYRLTLELKCEGLTPEQMGTRSVPPSDLSLLGMVQHLTRVEHRWFRSVLGGDPDAPRLHDESEVRDVLVHMVEEYARHMGHVDLLRECLDGRTGQ